MARTTVGNLNVMVGANIRGLSRGLARGSRRLQGFGATVARVGRQMTTAAVGVAVAATAIGGVMVRRQLQAIDTTAKLSRQIGGTTEGLIALQHAANLSGAGVQTMNNALQRMSRRIGLAVEGGGAAASMLEQLGLNARELADLNADKQFRVLAERISQIQNPAERGAAAFQIFGREGQALLPMLERGAAGIDEAERYARRLGLTVSSIQAARIEQLSDAFQGVRDRITGSSRAMLTALAPALNVGVNLFASFIDQTRAMMQRLSTSIITPAMNAIRGTMVGAWGEIRLSVGRAVAAIEGTVSAGASALWSITHSLISAIGPAVSSGLGGIVSAVKWTAETIALQFRLAEFTIINFRDTVVLASKRAQLGIVQLGNIVHHTFTEVIPSVATWFARNWRDILTDVANFSRAIFWNLAGNIVNVVKNIPAMIRGEVRFGDLWTPLTEGFTATLSELPNIAERQMGELERRLTGDVNKLSEAWGSRFIDFMNEREAEGEQMANRIGRFMRALAFGDDAQPARGIMLDAGEDFGDGFSNTAEAQLREDRQLDLLRAGSAEAQRFAHELSRRMGSGRTDREALSAAKRTEKNTAATARAVTKMAQPRVVSIT